MESVLPEKDEKVMGIPTPGEVLDGHSQAILSNPLGAVSRNIEKCEYTKKNDKQLVSVIIPTYNRAWCLEKTVLSVFRQNYRPIECILVDDGSTDGTIGVAESLSAYAPEGVTLRYVLKENAGPNSARNRGLTECSGDLICYLDSDDTLPADSIGRRVDLLKANPECDFCYGRTAILDEDGRQIRAMNEPWPSEGEGRIARYLFTSSAPLIRRSLCDTVGYWREDDRHGQEYEYFARLKFYCTHATFTYETVSFYTKHNRDHIFDSSLEFNHAVYRMLCSVQSLVIFSPKDSIEERRALAAEFTKLGDGLSRQRDYSTASMAWINALCLAPSPKRLARCLWGASSLLMAGLRGLFTTHFTSGQKADSGRESHTVVTHKHIQPRSGPEFLESTGPADQRSPDGPANEPILAWWTGGYNNWGDIVTPFLIGALTNREVKRGHGSGCIYSIGSIISNVRRGGQIWGCGLLSRRHIPVPFPDDVIVHAVRGPLTRKALLAVGISVPEVYGDPVLLMPYLCRSSNRPKTEVGIICHYNDVPYLGDISGMQSYRIIDIQAGFLRVLEEVLDCEAIVSSSLHGLILAEAYGKPAAWLQVDKGKHLAGRNFKFKDYFLSTQRRPLYNRVRGGRTLDLNRIEWLKPPIIDLQPLLSSFPGANDLILSELRPAALEEL